MAAFFARELQRDHWMVALSVRKTPHVFFKMKMTSSILVQRR
jgi:hypothetical protein